MAARTSPARPSRIVSALEWIFEGHRAPAFMLLVTLLYELVIVVMLLVPTSATGFGAFAEEFKVWCFGLDPATGKLQPMYVAVMLAEPLAVVIGVTVLWGRTLRLAIRTRPRVLLPSAVAALLTIGAGSVAFGALRTTPKPAAELAFPAKELRTALPPPRIDLLDQDGARVTLDDLRGKVVLLTGVYATCNSTCPMILAQAKRALATLDPEERRDVVVLTVTLDPERDDTAARATMAKNQKVEAPAWRLLGGPVDAVERALDDLQIARERDPETGIITHVNVLAVIDRKGRLAYRFSLGDRQAEWLGDAMKLLVREAG